jgi:HEAT repeat protein
MRRRFCRDLILACTLLALASCSTRETKQALAQADSLASLQKYDEANLVLIDALRAREAKVRAGLPVPQPTDTAAIDALTKKVEADPEILKMERAQIPLYLQLEKPDTAAAVYADIVVGNPGDPVLAHLLNDKDAKIRTNVARTLGLINKADAIDPLIKAAGDVDQNVRSEAVASLGAIQSPRAIPTLIHALKDSYWLVRSEAADALGREKDPSAIEPLLATVSDSYADVETSAETALVNLCDIKGVPASTFAAHLTDPNAKILMISAICLAVRKDPRATPLLIKLAAAPDVPTRLHAVEGLGETGDPAVIPTLRQTLHDPEVNVRGWSIIGLDNLHDVASIPALKALSVDPAQTQRIHEFAKLAVTHLSSLAPAPPSTTAPVQTPTPAVAPAPKPDKK